MWKLGYNNWIKYGWGKNFSTTYQKKDQLHIDFSNYSPSPEKMTAIDAACLTVETIIKNYPAPYTLMCSGGEDSQAMIWAWKLSGAPFKIVSIRYISDGIFFNDYDLVTLNQFTEINNIPVQYYDFDVIDFLENSHSDTATQFDCGSPQISTHIKMTDLVETGTILFSGNFIVNDKFSRTGSINWILLSMHRYSLYLEETNSNKRIVPFFFLHRPELAYSFTSIHSMQELKYERLINNGFPVIPVIKHNGFEKLKNHYDQYAYRVTPSAKLKYREMPSKRTMDLLFRYPYGINSISNPVQYFIPETE